MHWPEDDTPECVIARLDRAIHNFRPDMKKPPGLSLWRFCFVLYPDYWAATAALRWGSFSLIRADLPLRSRR